MKELVGRMIVVGGLNTDIVAAGVDELLGPGELSRSGEVFIGPGGKSSNIARMSACLLGRDRVFTIARTSRDPYGLWQVPVKALREAGVNTNRLAVFAGTLQFRRRGIRPVAAEELEGIDG